MPDGDSFLVWPHGIMTASPSTSVIVLLGDPSTFPTELFLQQVNEDHAGLRVVGGMASGMRREGDCRLIFNGRVLPSGAIGVLLQGQSGVRGIVSQGCRPIGRPMVVTKAEEN